MGQYSKQVYVYFVANVEYATYILASFPFQPLYWSHEANLHDVW